MTQSLTGLTVIDASRVLAGPYCGQMLGDHGAQVIKVESPEGDETRTFGPPVRDGSAAYFHALNRNKRGITLDMSGPQGRDVLWRLLETADVLIENFKASTLRNWGIEDPSEICRRFPRLVHCRITGFGDDGPLGGLPGYDAAIQAMSGLMSVNGASEGPPLRMGVPVVDLATGMQAAIAVLAALQERSRSGLGQMCDVALYDCALSVTHPHLPNYAWSGKEPSRSGNAHPNIAPYDAFETATCPVYIAVGNDRQFAMLCTLLDCPEVAADPRFRRNVDRIAHRDELRQVLSRQLTHQDGQAVASRLHEAGVPVAPVLGIADVAASPHAKHREMFLERDGYRGTGFPVKLKRTPATLSRLPPGRGEHTHEVLREAGFSGEEIRELARCGALGAAAGEP
ncbi:CoA transferase [Ramlibacter tataouinensis]|uniref:CaiB/BaiF CoA transferase family protein n=1 Tax=Ramlibacter tataouinensis TaxID=94132 RepID=UPI0022F3F831|nr:CoA transferase [Ramlibacter tataouinensis]WBY01336.1 CoA transferase [Ramlibacter tataouinensis]